MTALPTSLSGREVLVLGLGASGLAMARWCARAGARVTVLDTRAEPPQAAALRAEWPGVRCCQGDFTADWITGRSWAMVCRSPGISPLQMGSLVQAARAVAIPVLGELDLFAQALATAAAQPEQPYRPQVLAITGTNGKTTTTSLTAHLLRAAGWSVAVAGNIGPTLLDVWQSYEASGEWPQAWVLELSSFQLEGVTRFHPTAATVLNVTQDHLDWHGSMEAYAEAKGRVFGPSTIRVLNRDDPVVMSWALETPHEVGGRRSRRRPPTDTPDQMLFGVEVPSAAREWGLETVNGMSWLVRAQVSDSAQPTEWNLQRLMPAEALRIRGRHNACNALAALALATAAGAPLAPMLHALRDYRGEPHRVEPVAIVNEVEYVDDSKGTNVGATVAAIRGLGTERRLVLILGGEGKGQDFTPLLPVVAAHVRAVALIGRDADQIRLALEPSGVRLWDAPDLGAAVAWCAEQALPGDAVLLSPACASLDMFRDYAHRAEVFVAAVRELQDAAGVVT